jgi:hypothetical protein
VSRNCITSKKHEVPFEFISICSSPWRTHTKFHWLWVSQEIFRSQTSTSSLSSPLIHRHWFVISPLEFGSGTFIRSLRKRKRLTDKLFLEDVLLFLSEVGNKMVTDAPEEMESKSTFSYSEISETKVSSGHTFQVC